LVLEAAEFAGTGTWRPDWPLELPPDAFTVATGEISGITLEGEDWLLTFRYDSNGKLLEFPFMLNNRMTQVKLDRDKKPTEMTLTFPSAEEPWKLEFLEYHDSNPEGFPHLVRGLRGNVWYFIYISWGINEITEIWYNEQGNLLEAYRFSVANVGQNRRIRAILDFKDLDNSSGTGCYYDSWGFVTEIFGPGGVYKVLNYREALPRYWERRPAQGDTGGAGEFYMQWDVNGFLVRMTERAGESNDPVDFRYEYTLDERGNWIERREIQMFRQFGLLVPSPGTIFKRVLEYR